MIRVRFVAFNFVVFNCKVSAFLILLIFFVLSYVVILTVSCTLPAFSKTYNCILVDMRMILKFRETCQV